MMYAVYSNTFHGWAVYESRRIDNNVVHVPISVPYKTEGEAIHVMYTVHEMREKLNLL